MLKQLPVLAATPIPSPLLPFPASARVWRRSFHQAAFKPEGRDARVSLASQGSKRLQHALALRLRAFKPEISKMFKGNYSLYVFRYLRRRNISLILLFTCIFCSRMVFFTQIKNIKWFIQCFAFITVPDNLPSKIILINQQLRVILNTSWIQVSCLLVGFVCLF